MPFGKRLPAALGWHYPSKLFASIAGSIVPRSRSAVMPFPKRKQSACYGAWIVLGSSSMLLIQRLHIGRKNQLLDVGSRTQPACPNKEVSIQLGGVVQRLSGSTGSHGFKIVCQG